MGSAPGTNGNQASSAEEIFRTHPELDRILLEGAKRGRNGVHGAVLRVLSLVSEGYPDLTPGKIWARLRELRDRPTRTTAPLPTDPSNEDETILRQGYSTSAAAKRRAIQAVRKRHPDWPRAAVWALAQKLGLRAAPVEGGPPSAGRRWTDRDVERLLSRAGYDPVGTLATLLERTPNAVRCKLASLGKGCRVSDSYSRRWIADALHVGFRAVDRLLEQGLLEMRIPLIASASLQRFLSTEAPSLGLAIPESLSGASALKPNARFTQEKIAEMLQVPLVEVRRWVIKGRLSAIDERITARSFERYCRKHASELNHVFLREDERRWLADEAGIKQWGNPNQSHCVRDVRKHACIVRECAGCRMEIRGNVYFRHIKVCPKVKAASSPNTLSHRTFNQAA